MKKYTVKIIKELNAEFIRDWRNLWEKLTYRNYVNSPDWMLSFMKGFGVSSGYLFVTIYESGKLVAVAPLVREKIFGVKIYKNPGNFMFGNPFLLDYSDRETISVLAKTLKEFNSVFLQEIPERLAQALDGEVIKVAYIKKQLDYYYDILKDQQGNVVIRKRAKRMRRVKAIQEHIKLKTYHGFGGVDWNVVFRIDKLSTKYKLGYGVFMSEENRSFFRALAYHFKDKVLINILYYKTIPVAYEIGIVQGSEYFGNQIAFVEKYEHLTPGKVTIVLLIERLGEMGIKRIHFGPGGNDIKRSFSSGTEPVCKAIISKNWFICEYFRTVFLLQDRTYHFLRRNKKVYQIYSKVKNFIVKR